MDKTAITRKLPSLPSRKLFENGLFVGKVLDYGCGKGKDCAFYNIEGWDPTYQPIRPKGKFDTILCTYVLCILPPGEEFEVLEDINKLLKKDGRAYITVRNDVMRSEKTRVGWRRRIELGLPLVYKNRYFRTYLWTKK